MARKRNGNVKEVKDEQAHDAVQRIEAGQPREDDFNLARAWLDLKEHQYYGRTDSVEEFPLSG